MDIFDVLLARKLSGGSGNAEEIVLKTLAQLGIVEFVSADGTVLYTDNNDRIYYL